MKTTANIGASVRQRLLNYAKAKNRPFVMVTVRTFLLPLVDSIRTSDPFTCHWNPPAGPWQP